VEFFYCQKSRGTVADQQTIDAAASMTAVTAKTAVAGGVAGVITSVGGLDIGLLISIFAAIGGLVVSFFGFLVTWYYKSKADQRAQELHEIELMKEKGECDVKQD